LIFDVRLVIALRLAIMRLMIYLPIGVTTRLLGQAQGRDIEIGDV
jgi:hypothetical protein